MTLLPENSEKLNRFIQTTDFGKGLLALDLDGTALLEDKGKVFISSSVEKGVKAIHDLKRPVVLNTLRFPLSVMDTIGREWYQIADEPILTVLLNGSILGYIKQTDQRLEYEELEAFPMSAREIDLMIQGMAELMNDGITELLLFFYSRDWKAGESLWTPNPARVDELRKKYVSASKIFAGTLDELHRCLQGLEICMTSLLVDRPQNTLMAYQHSKKNSFFTSAGVNKASGIRKIAERFGLSLRDSVGAGDTEMDTFLSEVGLAIIVGDAPLAYKGLIDTLRLESPLELGEFLGEFAAAAGLKKSV